MQDPSRPGRLTRLRRAGGGAALAAGLGLLLAPAAPALALGGGGTGGFGGGEGGGLGGLGGLAGHGFVFGPAWLVLLVFALRFVMAVYRRDAARRRRDGRPPFTPGMALSTLLLALLWPADLLREMRALRRRVPRVEAAAAQAAEEDPLFAADTVRVAGEDLFRRVQDAWSRDDRAELAMLVGDTLMVEWDRRLADFHARGWRNEVRILGDVDVRYVGLVNRGDEREDQVCVRLAARVHDVVRDRGGGTVRRRGSVSEAHRVCEYWTLGKRAGRWVVVRIEQRREGLHQLFAPIVATPWGDDERLRREATVEQAAETRASTTDLVAIGRPEIEEHARLAALDLSLVDGRFAPDVLVAEVRYAVGAWADAIDGDRTALAAIADPAALAELLYADDAAHDTRIVVRGLTVEGIRIAALASDVTPARMTVDLHASGIIYTEDRSTLIVVDGDRSRRRTFTQRWALALSDAPEHPWRLVAASHT